VKKQLMAVVVALFVCLGYSGAMAPTMAYAADTIGYVDYSRVFSHHPDFASARAALSLEDEKAQKEFREKAPSLDDNGKRALNNQLTERMAKRERELFNPIEEKILKAVREVAKERGISVVLQRQMVIVGGVDLTNDVLKAVSAN
jgi:outer membrane protein